MDLARHYTDPSLAAIYDVENAGRDGPDFYLALAAQRGAQRVADLGCGTGSLACELAERGHQVTGIDPAPAMLEVARTRDDSSTSFPARGGAEAFDSWVETVSVGDGTVSFVSLRRFQPSGREERIDSTLRFRSRDELVEGLLAAGFQVRSQYGDWERSSFVDRSPEIILVAERR